MFNVTIFMILLSVLTYKLPSNNTNQFCAKWHKSWFLYLFLQMDLIHFVLLIQTLFSIIFISYLLNTSVTVLINQSFKKHVSWCFITAGFIAKRFRHQFLYNNFPKTFDLMHKLLFSFFIVVILSNFWSFSSIYKK